MTAAQNVAFPLEMRRYQKGETGVRVREALALIELTGFENRLPNQLSSGQQQRVGLARALTYAPPIMHFQEPIGAIDRSLRDAMQSELKALHQKLRITFIYVTHDQEEALAG
jgi:ABC-type Fe3+/spermidine/putrescine transport system ATPase subunit